VFALDHDGECKEAMKSYLDCLKAKKGTHFDCRELSGKYLKCRMDRDLMAKEDLDSLGLGELDIGYVRKVMDPVTKREGSPPHKNINVTQQTQQEKKAVHHFLNTIVQLFPFYQTKDLLLVQAFERATDG
jgi:hypothetical protein